MDNILKIPYFSQYSDIEEKEHLLTACGMTCVYMALKYYMLCDDPLDKIVAKGVSDGGYTESGWSHDYLVSVFENYGVSCNCKEQMRDRDVKEIWDSLKNKNPVIISMQRFSFDRRIFHMVILTGFRENVAGNLEGFFYHDPAGMASQEVAHLFVSVPVFLQYWRKMAIFPKLDKQ